jgi:hypothetical protein
MASAARRGGLVTCSLRVLRRVHTCSGSVVTVCQPFGTMADDHAAGAAGAAGTAGTVLSDVDPATLAAAAAARERFPEVAQQVDAAFDALALRVTQREEELLAELEQLQEAEKARLEGIVDGYKKQWRILQSVVQVARALVDDDPPLGVNAGLAMAQLEGTLLEQLKSLSAMATNEAVEVPQAAQFELKDEKEALANLYALIDQAGTVTMR